MEIFKDIILQGFELKEAAIREYKSSYLDEISLSGLFLRSKVSSYQKSLANNYITIRKIFSYTVVQPKVTNVEYNKLREINFAPVEYTAPETMYEELMLIVDWSNSKDYYTRKFADEVFEIRVRELKYLLANTSNVKLMELNGGYRVLERYLEFIAG